MLIVVCFSVFNDFFLKKIIAENENLLLHYSRCLLCFQHLKSSYKCHELGRSNFHGIPTHMRGEERGGREGEEREVIIYLSVLSMSREHTGYILFGIILPRYSI